MIIPTNVPRTYTVIQLSCTNSISSVGDTNLNHIAVGMNINVPKSILIECLSDSTMHSTVHNGVAQ